MLLRGAQFPGTFWFAPKKLHFGSSAVPHYNAVSRVVASLVTRWNSTPTMGYFGDSRIPSVILVRAPLLGVHVEPRSVGVSMSLTLDVRTYYPTSKSSFLLVSSLGQDPPARREAELRTVQSPPESWCLGSC